MIDSRLRDTLQPVFYRHPLGVVVYRYLYVILIPSLRDWVFFTNVTLLD